MWTWLLILVVRFSEAFFGLRRRAAAQGLVEYAIILSLIAVVVVGILTALGRTLCTGWYIKLVGPGSPFYNPGASCT